MCEGGRGGVLSRKKEEDYEEEEEEEADRLLTFEGSSAVAGSKVQTKAFLSCEHETILLLTEDQSIELTNKSCFNKYRFYL